jgi:hypothetical protein
MMYNLMAHFSTSDGVPPALKDGETSYTGQQAFSQILPATLHVDVGETKIVSGELVAGQVQEALPDADDRYPPQRTTTTATWRPYMLDNTRTWRATG